MLELAEPALNMLRDALPAPLMAVDQNHTSVENTSGAVDLSDRHKFTGFDGIHDLTRPTILF